MRQGPAVYSTCMSDRVRNRMPSHERAINDIHRVGNVGENRLSIAISKETQRRRGGVRDKGGEGGESDKSIEMEKKDLKNDRDP